MLTKSDAALWAGLAIAAFVIFDMLDGDPDMFRALVGQIALFAGV